MATMIFTVAFGLGSVILGYPDVLQGVRWIGAAVLCWFAWKIATARYGDGDASTRPVGLVSAAAFQWVNPKAWLVSASAVATFLHASEDRPLLQSAALAILFFVAAIPSCLPWLAFGAFLQRVLRSKRAFRAFNVAMGLLLAASVILIIR